MVKSSSCCVELVGLKKGPWTPEEDEKLMAYIQQHGHGSWSSLPAKAGLKRDGKSCRLRWINYLRPDIKRGNFSLQEDQTIIQLHALLGNKWSAIALHLPKRTDNEIKNYWNTCLKKRLTRMGINPTTHKPMNDVVNCESKEATNLSHMAQWETAWLQAEARQVREYSKLQLQNQQLGSPSMTRLLLNKITLTPWPSPPACLDMLKAWQNSWSSASKPSTDQNNPRMHRMYAMMLATDDLESQGSTLCFPDAIVSESDRTNSNSTFGMMDQCLLASSSSGEPWGNKVGSFGDDNNIMAAVEAFGSRGYDCNSMEGLHNNGDVLMYEGLNENFVEERQDWDAILELLDGLPSSPSFPVL